MRVEGTLHIATSCGTRRVPLTFTTEHAASSYGLPVCVMGGRAYGPGDLDGDLTTDSRDWRAVAAIRRAGYTVDAPAVRPRPYTDDGFW